MNRNMVLAEWQRATQSLHAAELLAREGYREDAVSRAYYAVLHAAKAALLVHDVATTSHAAVRRMFGRHLPFLLAISAAPCYEQYRGREPQGQDTQPMRRGVDVSTIVSIALLLVFLQPAYANGEHVHVGGLFLVLLGGVVFVGSFVVVFYFLLRSTPDEAQEEQERDE